MNAQSPKYMQNIELEKFWHLAPEHGISCGVSSPLVEATDIQALTEVYQNTNVTEIPLTYLDAALLMSRHGYDTPFFSAENQDGNSRDFRQFIDEILIARLNFDWVVKKIDGAFDSKQTRQMLDKVESKALDLVRLQSELSDHFHLWKILADENDSDFVENGERLLIRTWFNEYARTQDTLYTLADRAKSTSEMLKPPGGAPVKYSTTWLIYEDWNVDELKAGVSLSRIANEFSGPFIRFLSTFERMMLSESVTSGNERLSAEEYYTPRNYGLGSEASKIIRYRSVSPDKKPQRRLRPNTDSNKIADTLVKLIAYKTRKGD